MSNMMPFNTLLNPAFQQMANVLQAAFNPQMAMQHQDTMGRIGQEYSAGIAKNYSWHMAADLRQNILNSMHDVTNKANEAALKAIKDGQNLLSKQTQ